MFHKITPRMRGLPHFYQGAYGSFQLDRPPGNIAGVLGAPAVATININAGAVKSVAGAITLLLGGRSAQGDGTLGFKNLDTGVFVAGMGNGSTLLNGMGTGDFGIWVNQSKFAVGTGNGSVINLGIDNNGAVTITPRVGVSGTPGLQVSGANVSGARGLVVLGGTTGSTDVCFLCNDAPSSVNLFEILCTPAVQARGPVAAALVDMTPDHGSYTGTLTGCTTSPTATIKWARMGNLVVLFIPGLTGTSNATTCTITGAMPASIQPVSTQWMAAPLLEDATAVFAGGVAVNAASSTLTLEKGGTSTGFTASGTKGVSSGMAFAYQLT